MKTHRGRSNKGGTHNDEIVNTNVVGRGATWHHLAGKLVYFGSSHVRQSTAASFRFLKMAFRIDLANVGRKSAKTRRTSRIVVSPCRQLNVTCIFSKTRKHFAN